MRTLTTSRGLTIIAERKAAPAAETARSPNPKVTSEVELCVAVEPNPTSSTLLSTAESWPSIHGFWLFSVSVSTILFSPNQLSTILSLRSIRKKQKQKKYFYLFFLVPWRRGKSKENIKKIEEKRIPGRERENRVSQSFGEATFVDTCKRKTTTTGL